MIGEMFEWSGRYTVKGGGDSSSVGGPCKDDEGRQFLLSLLIDHNDVNTEYLYNVNYKDLYWTGREMFLCVVRKTDNGVKEN